MRSTRKKKNGFSGLQRDSSSSHDQSQPKLHRVNEVWLLISDKAFVNEENLLQKRLLLCLRKIFRRLCAKSNICCRSKLVPRSKTCFYLFFTFYFRINLFFRAQAGQHDTAKMFPQERVLVCAGLNIFLGHSCVRCLLIVILRLRNVILKPCDVLTFNKLFFDTTYFRKTQCLNEGFLQSHLIAVRNDPNNHN